MINYVCNKCNNSISDSFFLLEKGNQRGLYCGECGQWQKWLGKNEYNLFHFLECERKRVKP